MIEIHFPENNEIPFSKVKNGDMFLCDDDLYLKFNSSCFADNHINTIHISTGYLMSFEENEKVIPVNAEIFIKLQ